MSKKINIEEIKSKIKDRNIEFLDSVYKNNKFKHSWKCGVCGYKWKASLVNIYHKNSGCPNCAGQVIDKNKLIKHANDKGGKLISSLDEYKNNKTKLIWECAKGHQWRAKWQNILSGKWCPVCANNKKHPLSYIKNKILKKDYKLKSEYKGMNYKVELECPEKHIWYTTLGNFKKGNTCPICSHKGLSRAQIEIETIIKLYKFETISNYKPDFMQGRELDIYIPDLNLAIEYCGLYWHTEDSPESRDRNYHSIKHKLCEENGIRLITIFEDEWVYRKKQVLNFLKSVLGIYEKKLFARKCKVKRVDSKEAIKFLHENHIQGGSVSVKSSFGLYYADELVAVITGALHHRNNNDFVLNRLAFKDGYQVVGGASKLLKSLEKDVKKYGKKTLISWSDNRWSMGIVYKKMKFTLAAELYPDYAYINMNKPRKRLSKQSCTKCNLLRKGAKGATELEMAKSLNYSRIWDCGKKRWIKHI